MHVRTGGERTWATARHPDRREAAFCYTATFDATAESYGCADSQTGTASGGNAFSHSVYLYDRHFATNSAAGYAIKYPTIIFAFACNSISNSNRAITNSRPIFTTGSAHTDCDFAAHS